MQQNYKLSFYIPLNFIYFNLFLTHFSTFNFMNFNLFFNQSPKITHTTFLFPFANKTFINYPSFHFLTLGFFIYLHLLFCPFSFFWYTFLETLSKSISYYLKSFLFSRLCSMLFITLSSMRFCSGCSSTAPMRSLLCLMSILAGLSIFSTDLSSPSHWCWPLREYRGFECSNCKSTPLPVRYLWLRLPAKSCFWMALLACFLFYPFKLQTLLNLKSL